ncbi:MAG: ABC transporter permease [Bacteroidetes bacterium]|nr:ABC transporter permease [Bacteroidota bacterium]
MNKIFLIIRREYLSRVRKKSFIVMTILGPLLIGGIFAATFLLNKVDTEKHTIVVLDNTHLFANKFKSDERLNFIYLDQNLDSLRSQSKELGYFAVLYIPAIEKLELLEKSVTLYSETQPSIEIISKIKFSLEKEINAAKYVAAGIDEKKLNSIKTEVDIKTRDLQNKETNSDFITGIGFAAGLMIYMFIFIYGAMVMRGVMEEKMSRIVEVIISSVKPFQLMMGKIIGVAMVGLTQFLLWVILSTAVISFVTARFMGDKTNEEKIEQMAKVNGNVQSMNQFSSAMNQMNNAPANKLSVILEGINFPLIIVTFIFYFLGGYLLYSALFAAIGSAVDSETDTQQFMLPVTIPLILGYIASVSVINNPTGAVAFWFSIIPLTSPIVMMVRIPFGVPGWQIGLSMGLLILGFIFTTWLAGKIYRTGILMYGKKVSYGELAKWIRYKN